MYNHEHSNTNSHIMGAATLFIILSLIASTMLFIALLLWLAEVIGSLIGALVIIGGSATLVALILYIFTLRPEVRRLRHEISTLYEITTLARTGYSWITQQLSMFLK